MHKDLNTEENSSFRAMSSLLVKFRLYSLRSQSSKANTPMRRTLGSSDRSCEDVASVWPWALSSLIEETASAH